MLEVPPRLQVHRQRRIANELGAVTRHAVRNKLASARNAAFFVKRKVEGSTLLTEEPKVARFLELLDGELEAASQLLELTSDGAPARCDAAGIIHALVADLRFPPSVEVLCEDGPPVQLACAPADLELALFELLANAVDAGARRVVLSWLEGPSNDAVLSVADDGAGLTAPMATLFEPGFTSRENHLGVGLKMARRMMAIAHATLTLEPGPARGAVARVSFPRSES